MMAYNLLSEPIRRFIRDKRWEELRPIQTAAIEKILSTEDHYILSSRTASGKTEAAFLPILSRADFSKGIVPVLYIAPLIALINDQFLRIEELCKYMEIPITKWHGEASRTSKEKVVKDPEGIILITPESLEAMFVNKPAQVKHLLGRLAFVVIDEIHSFIGSDRGIQLQSLLYRLQALQQKSFRIVGLSATLGDFEQVRQFTGDLLHTRVLIDRTGKNTIAEFHYRNEPQAELSLALLKDIYCEVHSSKVLLFPNSRGMAEEAAVKLKKLAERVGGHPYYFSHHSSVDKEVREYVEHFAKNNTYHPFCICCTSTLEMGIDIGSVDLVIQIDAAHSIASMVQRIGRSGRRNGQASRLVLYATNPWSLLHALACWELYQQQFIEPAMVSAKPFDIVLHQLLSVVKGKGEITEEELIAFIRSDFAFPAITGEEVKVVIAHLVKTGFLEKIGQQLILGLDAEPLVNNKDFYSVFQSEELYKIIHEGNTIGSLPLPFQLEAGNNIYLAAKIWTVKDLDLKAKKAYVQPAQDGKKPLFSGGGGVVHPRIREKMLEILCDHNTFEYLDQTGAEALGELRTWFSFFQLKAPGKMRPLLVKANKLELYTFTGTMINRALVFLLQETGITVVLMEQYSMLEINASVEEFKGIWGDILAAFDNIDERLTQMVRDEQLFPGFSKWAGYLPIAYQVQLIKDKMFDFQGAWNFITQMELITTPEVGSPIKSVDPL